MRMRLKYIYRSRDRHGNVRVYFRRGAKKVRIREPFGSGEFLTVYNHLLGPSGVQKAARGARLGTLRWLCEQYFKSSAFRQLDARTQHVRRRVLEGAWAEPTQPGGTLKFGDVTYPHINAKTVRVLLDRKLGAPESGNARVEALRQVFAWALAEECRASA